MWGLIIIVPGMTTIAAASYDTQLALAANNKVEGTDGGDASPLVLKGMIL